MNHQRWLLGELDTWLAEGLIEAQQATALRARYAGSAPNTPWARIIFSSIGAVLLGLGLILLFAYNWAGMHKFAKLGVIFIVLIAAHSAGLACRHSNRFHPALGEGFQLMGTVFFGAGIWLVAQIYHIQEHYPTAFLIWGVGALSLAWTLPSITQGLVASILIGVWHGSEVLDFDTANHGVLVLVLLGLCPLAGYLRSRVLLFIALVTLYFSLITTLATFADEWMLPIVMSLACLLLALREVVIRQRWFAEGAGCFSVLGFLTYFILVYVLIFPDILYELVDPEPDTLSMVYLATLALPTLALWGWLLLQNTTRTTPISVWLEQGTVVTVLGLLLATMLLTHNQNQPQWAWLTVIACNVALLIHGGIFIIEGSAAARPFLAALGCLLIAAVVISRYLDLFDSLLMRSLAFFILGAIVFLAGNFYSRQQVQQP